MIIRGLRKLIAKNFKYGVQEVFKGAILAAQVKELQKYVPDVKPSDIQRFIAKLLFIIKMFILFLGAQLVLELKQWTEMVISLRISYLTKGQAILVATCFM